MVFATTLNPHLFWYTTVKPVSEPRIASLFAYRVNKDIEKHDIRHLLDCANSKVLDICVLSHELAKRKSLKL